MIRMRPFRFIIALGVSLAAASCASPDPKLYTIAPVPGGEHAGGPKVVGVRSVGVAHYLARDQIVRSSEDYRVEVKANEWWAEPLDEMLTRVLQDDLSQRLPGSTVFLSAGAVTESSDATVELQVQRLDADRTGNLILNAQGSVSFNHQPNSDTRGFHIATPLASPAVEGQVAATSTALGQVADQLAAMLVARQGRK
jgi:uncharacterized lipoprotein YmbA